MVEVKFHHLHILLFSAMELTKTLSDHVQCDDPGQEPRVSTIRMLLDTDGVPTADGGIFWWNVDSSDLIISDRRSILRLMPSGGLPPTMSSRH